MAQKALIVFLIVDAVLLIYLVLRSSKNRPHQPADVYQEIAQHFGGNPLDRSMPTAVDWVRTSLQAHGIDPDDSPVRAMKQIREAKPGLSLSAAKTLVDAVRKRL